MKKNLMSFKKWTGLLSLFVVITSCHKEREDSPVIEKEINRTGFSKINAAERFNVTVTKGAAFSIKAKGPANDVNDIVFGLGNGILDIHYDKYYRKRAQIDITITMPTLISISLAGASKGIVNGFQDENHVIRTVLAGASQCTLNGAGIYTQIELSGASELVANGTTERLYGNISGASKLNAYGLQAGEADIDASGASVARIKVANNLVASVSGASRIYYKGDPNEKHIESSGGGKVIQE